MGTNKPAAALPATWCALWLVRAAWLRLTVLPPIPAHTGPLIEFAGMVMPSAS